MSDDEEPSPESDPYCAHWYSIFSDSHPDVKCENCGESCREHPALWGCWCPTAQPGDKPTDANHFKSVEWPAEETVRPKQR